MPITNAKKRRARADEEWERKCAEESARIARQREVFARLPHCRERQALMAAMLDRAFALLDGGQCEACDALLEFVPEEKSDALLSEYFNDG